MLEQIRRTFAQMNKDSALDRRYPELAAREHLVSQSPAGIVLPEIEAFADYAKVYQSYVWVRKAITKIADSIISLPVRVVDVDGEEVTPHPVTELLDFVNDTYDATVLWSLWLVHMMLGGESFFEVVPDGNNNPVELWARRPDTITVIPDAALPAYPRVFTYQRDDEVQIPPDWMIADRFINPLNDFRGIAPIHAVREGLIIDIFAQAWSKGFLKRGARPDWALVAPEGITQTEREQYEYMIEKKFAGVDNAHKPIILEDGVVDIKTLSFTPKDIEWLEQRKFSRDEVAAIFGVPDEIMGFGRDTYENFGTAHEVFWLLTLKPLTDHRDNVLTRFFRYRRPMLADGERVETDTSEIGALQEDIAPAVETATKFWGMGVPYNTVEERLGLGTGPIPGGDVGYLPFSVVPVGSGAPEAQQGDQQPTDGSEDESPAPDDGQRAGVVRQLKRAMQAHQNVVLRSIRDRQPVDWHRASVAFRAEYNNEMLVASVESHLRGEVATLSEGMQGVELHDAVAGLYAALKTDQIETFAQAGLFFEALHATRTVRFIPRGSDNPLPAIGEVEIDDIDADRSVNLFERTIRGYRGMLDAVVTGQQDFGEGVDQ